MSAPDLPTLDEIVREGLRKAGTKNPSSELLNRASTTWMAEIKNDISMLPIQRPRFLQITSYGILTVGQSRYSNPADFGHDLALTLLDGSVKGTAQAGSSNTLTLEAGVALQESDLIGKDILITGGTGVGSFSQITAFNSLTLAVTVTPNFNTAPAANSTYLIVTEKYDIDPGHVASRSAEQNITFKDRPTVFSQIGDDDYGEFILNCPPDKAYGARLRYYADVGRMDLNGTHIQTLYYRWRNLWTLGIEYRQRKDNEDDQTGNAKNAYGGELLKLKGGQYGLDLNAQQGTVEDYYG